MKHLVFLTMLFTLGCASTTKEGAVDADRRQFLLIPQSQVLQLSAQAYNQTLAEAQKKGILNQDPKALNRLRQILAKLVPPTAVFRQDALSWPWQVNLISSKELNAYCMPGGKIIFYTGIIDQLQLTDAEIAAIMGHEIAHALREHGRERMSEALAQQVGLQALVLSGAIDQKYAGALAAVVNVAIALPHSRGQESEADRIGVELMARAGFNPESAVTLWEKMSRAAGGKSPPEFLSTHPSSSTRIQKIQSLLPTVMPLYREAGGAGGTN